MLLRVTVHPEDQPAYTLEFFDPDLARDMMRLVASGTVSVRNSSPSASSPSIQSPGSSAANGFRDPDPVDREMPGSPEVATLIADPDAYRQAADYCRSVNPLGDMRRVVVATYAAELYLGAEGVSATELAGIFDANGWPQPTDFVQAIRNAAREKFGWLERVGNPGYYKVTATGRAAVLGETISEQPTTSPLPFEQLQTNGIYETSNS